MAGLPPQDPPKPLPDEASVKAAEKLIREIFQEDYARKTPADQAALGRKLLKQAGQTKDDPPALYVLLREAHDRSTQGGDIRGSLEALDRLAAEFAINRLAMKQAAAEALSRFAKAPDDFKPLAKIFMDLADDAIAVDDFDRADKALESAVQVSKSAKDLPSVTRAEAKRREIKDLKGASDLLKKARETLATSPNDPGANEALGRHECFRRQNWAVGLPMLAQAADATLKDLAALDLKAPAETAAQMSLADAWWDRAEKESGAAKSGMRARAGLWYRRALPSLSGLTRAKVEKKIGESPAIRAQAPTEGLVAWWKFDEGSGATIADAAGGGHAGTALGNPAWGRGKSGGALEFDGVDDWITVADSPRLRDLQKDSYTLSAWFKPARVPPGKGAANDANYAILVKAGFHNGLVFTATGSKAVLSLQHWVAGPKMVPIFGERGLTPGTWYHVAGVLDLAAGSGKVYVNGQLDGSAKFPPRTPALEYGVEPWKIGVARPAGKEWGWSMHGALDELRVYSRALSDDEIKSLAVEPLE